MVTGLGFRDMNLTICEGVPCCLMTMAPPPTHKHGRARHEAQIGHRGYCSLLRGSSYNNLDLQHNTLIRLPSYPLPSPFAMPHPPAYPMPTPSLILPVASPCPALAMPSLFVGHGIKCMMVAAMTMTFASMLCYCACSWPCACARAHVRKCGWFVPSWFFLIQCVCMYVCV